MSSYHIPLLPERTYHLISRANGSEKIFREPMNYSFFLEKLKKYVLPVIDLYAYCLLPNHFHLLGQIKNLQAIESHFELKKPGRFFSEKLTSDFIMERFSNMLNSYCKSYNKMYLRKGSLFIDYLRRVEIISSQQVCSTGFYVHKNPVHHGYCTRMRDWPWSSYQDFLAGNSEIVSLKKMMSYYGSESAFKQYHQQPILKRF